MLNIAHNSVAQCSEVAQMRPLRTLQSSRRIFAASSFKMCPNVRYIAQSGNHGTDCGLITQHTASYSRPKRQHYPLRHVRTYVLPAIAAYRRLRQRAGVYRSAAD